MRFPKILDMLIIDTFLDVQGYRVKVRIPYEKNNLLFYATLWNLACGCVYPFSGEGGINRFGDRRGFTSFEQSWNQIEDISAKSSLG